jgi:hypothetical protein
VRGVARRWRLNPPPNWPTLPEGWEPGPDWAPKREWGPAPAGWTLWRREGRGAWLARHRRTAGLGSAAVLTIFVALAGPPATGTFQNTAPPRVQAAPSVTDAAAEPLTPGDRPLAEPVIRLQRRTPPASRERRPAAAAATATTGAAARSDRPRDRRRTRFMPAEPSATPSQDPCPPEGPGASAAPSATPEWDPFVAGSETGECPGEGERIGFPRPTPSGSPDPPD